MKKKILAITLCVAMLAIMLVSGTLAYFTDSAEQENVFAVGNIEIELTEEVSVTDQDGKKLDKVEQTASGATYSNLMPTNKIVKEPVIENTGDNDAYVRVVVTMNNVYELNQAIDDVYEGLGWTGAEVQEKYDEVFDGWGINYNPRPGKNDKNDARGIIDNRADGTTLLAVDFTKTTLPAGHHIFGLDNWFLTDAEKNDTQGDPYEAFGSNGSYVGYYTNGMTDGQFRWTFYLHLTPGQRYTLFNGLNVPADFDSNRVVGDKTINQMAFFDELNIDIKADAIQKEGFADAKAAFTALQEAHPIA